MFAGEAKKVIWRTVHRIVRETFMNIVRQNGEKGHLANISPRCSRNFYEQCSQGLQNRLIGEQFVRELFAELFAERFAKMYGSFRDRK